VLELLRSDGGGLKWELAPVNEPRRRLRTVGRIVSTALRPFPPTEPVDAAARVATNAPDRNGALAAGDEAHAALARLSCGISRGSLYKWDALLEEWASTNGFRVEPGSSERPVCCPELSYAGRIDCVVRSPRGRTLIIELKTADPAKVQDKPLGRAADHLQAALLRRAARASGDAVDAAMLVYLDESGAFSQIECQLEDEVAVAAVHWARARDRLRRQLTHGGTRDSLAVTYLEASPDQDEADDFDPDTRLPSERMIDSGDHWLDDLDA
jgi:hypothetical protein